MLWVVAFSNSSISLGMATRRTELLLFGACTTSRVPEPSRTRAAERSIRRKPERKSMSLLRRAQISPRRSPVFRIRRTQSPVMSSNTFCASAAISWSANTSTFLLRYAGSSTSLPGQSQWHFFFTTLKIVFSSTPTSLVLLHDKPLSCSREKNTESFSAVRSRSRIVPISGTI